MADWRSAADAIAGDRVRGAATLLAELLPVLDAAVAEGREATLEVARCVCTGQPAMASLWNICAAALAEFEEPGRYAQRRAEFARSPRALTRAATMAMRDALLGEASPQLLTVSYSSSVAAVLAALGPQRPTVVCAESLPGGEGRALAVHLVQAGVDARIVSDAQLTRELSTATAVVVGADTVAPRHWTNKAGTFGLAAAAHFAHVPVYVISGREKAASELLASQMTLSALSRTRLSSWRRSF